MVKRNFASFIRRVEGLPEVEEVDLKLFSPDVTMTVDRRYILNLFDTPEWEDTWITCLFTWAGTEQGHRYWHKVCKGGASESHKREAYAMLRYWKKEVCD